MPKPVKAPVAAATCCFSTAAASPAAPASSKGGVKSPLPGVIKDIKCKVGDDIKRGQTILVLEAMKMENNINSDKDGKVVEIKVNKGDSVLEGTDLIIIEYDAITGRI
jgi:biotin carboxyl carrier protein